MKFFIFITVSLMALSIPLTALADEIKDAEEQTKRPPEWAQPIALEGVPNLHRISDGIYRSAQPTALGMKNLKAMGIETIVNLRSFHSDRDEIGDLGLAYEHIYMKAWHPEEKEAVRFLQIVTNSRRIPVLFHCQHGADRTGTMCAIYRVAIQGWSKEAAIREMTQGGYGFHGVWQNLIHWLNGLNIDRIKKRAGIS
jgi:protein tyrosine/serine phosphatase